MDADRNQSGDYERDWLESDRRARVQSQSPREQPHHPVLGDSGGDNDNGTGHYYVDLHLTAIHDILHDDINHIANVHHHHGPELDILIHQHEYDGGWHDHFISDFDNNAYYVIDLDKQHYGPADHTHDDDRPADVNVSGIRIDNNDPYGHDDNDNIINTPGYGS